MERTQSRESVIVPVIALVMAVAAAVSLGVGDAVGFLSDAAEDVFFLTGLLGWMLLAWAALLGGGYAILLISRLFTKQPVLVREAGITAASLGVVVVVLVMHPLWGSGSAIA